MARVLYPIAFLLAKLALLEDAIEGSFDPRVSAAIDRVLSQLDQAGQA
jgi:hypothetical protein